MAFEYKPLIKTIEIEGKPYQLELGNYTYLAKVDKFQKDMAKLDPEKADWSNIANRVVDLITSALGRAQAKKLLDGRELHFVWVSQLLAYIEQELSSPESVKCVTDAMGAMSETIDDD